MASIVVKQADFWSELDVVKRFFGELHRYNANLDAQFALADNWDRRFLAYIGGLCKAGVYLARYDGQVAGLLIMAEHRDDTVFGSAAWAELVALYVDPAYRRKGVARALISRAKAWSTELGYDRVCLYVTSANHTAKDLYAAHGFERVQEFWRWRSDSVD